MILLTRLGGHALAVNPDLIERAECTPDTILTMVDGRKLLVCESLEEVVDLVRTWRATIAAQAFSLSALARVPANPADDEELEPSGQRRRDYHGHPSTFRQSGSSARAAGSRGPQANSQPDPRDEELAAHAVTETSLARVLRLPQRGV